MADKKAKTQKKLKTEIQLLYTTWPDGKSAQKAARELLRKNLATCVNLWPMDSVFAWKGKMASAKEYVALVKTDSKRLDKCRAFLKQYHPYEVPCLLGLTPTSCNPEYESWLLGPK